jgi:hypothetical protein
MHCNRDVRPELSGTVTGQPLYCVVIKTSTSTRAYYYCNGYDLFVCEAYKRGGHNCRALWTWIRWPARPLAQPKTRAIPPWPPISAQRGTSERCG